MEYADQTAATSNELLRRQELHLSLANPHPDTLELARLGFDTWVDDLPKEDVEQLVDGRAGVSVMWVAGEGWVEEVQ